MREVNCVDAKAGIRSGSSTEPGNIICVISFLYFANLDTVGAALYIGSRFGLAGLRTAFWRLGCACLFPRFLACWLGDDLELEAISKPNENGSL